MARVELIYYTCDCCKNKFSYENRLKMVRLPARTFDCEGYHCGRDTTKLQLCSNCFDNLADVIFEQFAQIDSGIGMDKVVPKFDCSSWQTEKIDTYNGDIGGI